MGYATKAKALKDGHSLIKKMKTSGWKLRVWENMGWHYSIRKGAISISPVYYGRSYMALMSSSTLDARDPNKAYENQLKAVKKFMKARQKDISDSE